MKQLISAAFLVILSGAVLAEPESTSPTDADRAFGCGGGLSADLVLHAVAPVDGGAGAAVYNGVSSMRANGRTVDPATLRFINEKVAGRAINSVGHVCSDKDMTVTISTTADGKATVLLTVTVQQGKLSVS